jgi:hypothetical protein
MARNDNLSLSEQLVLLEEVRTKIPLYLSLFERERMTVTGADICFALNHHPSLVRRDRRENLTYPKSSFFLKKLGRKSLSYSPFAKGRG